MGALFEEEHAPELDDEDGGLVVEHLREPLLELLCTHPRRELLDNVLHERWLLLAEVPAMQSGGNRGGAIGGQSEGTQRAMRGQSDGDERGQRSIGGRSEANLSIGGNQRALGVRVRPRHILRHLLVDKGAELRLNQAGGAHDVPRHLGRVQRLTLRRD